MFELSIVIVPLVDVFDIVEELIFHPPILASAVVNVPVDASIVVTFVVPLLNVIPDELSIKPADVRFPELFNVPE